MSDDKKAPPEDSPQKRAGVNWDNGEVSYGGLPQAPDPGEPHYCDSDPVPAPDPSHHDHGSEPSYHSSPASQPDHGSSLVLPPSNQPHIYDPDVDPPTTPAPIPVGGYINSKWIAAARGEIGISEKEESNHPRIEEYFGTTNCPSCDVTEDGWCSAFVNWSLKQAGIVGTNDAAAEPWMRWGIEPETPVPGCVVVLKKEGQWHVGFYMGTSENNDSRIRVLAGNQSNAVNVKTWPKAKVKGYRVPHFIL